MKQRYIWLLCMTTYVYASDQQKTKKQGATTRQARFVTLGKDFRQVKEGLATLQEMQQQQGSLGERVTALETALTQSRCAAHTSDATSEFIIVPTRIKACVGTKGPQKEYDTCALLRQMPTLVALAGEQQKQLDGLSRGLDVVVKELRMLKSRVSAVSTDDGASTSTTVTSGDGVDER